MPDTGEDFDQFFRREFGALVAFVRKLGFELEDARDAAAEAMKDAYRNWARLETPLPWIRVAAQRVALHHVRNLLKKRLDDLRRGPGEEDGRYES